MSGQGAATATSASPVVPVAFDPSAGIFFKAQPLSEKTALVATNLRQLQAVVDNPAALQPKSLRTRADLSESIHYNSMIQRLLVGAKKTNVKSFRIYIRQTVLGERDGILPPIHLWSPSRFVVTPPSETGLQQYVCIPHDAVVLSIDGQTQLTALYEEYSGATGEYKEKLGKYPVSVVLVHGVPVEIARQFFHDLNTYGVAVNSSQALGMDSNDPVTRIANRLEASVPQLNGRIDKQSRQLPKGSNALMTIHSLRQFIVNVGKGISGIQYGSKAVPVDDIDLERLENIARVWLEAYLNAFASEIQDREDFVASAPPVLAAVGAMGNDLYAGPAGSFVDARARELVNSLSGVNWRKGPSWDGVVGKFTPTGKFAVGGTKEVAYTVFAALKNTANPGFAQIRGRSQ